MGGGVQGEGKGWGSEGELVLGWHGEDLCLGLAVELHGGWGEVLLGWGDHSLLLGLCEARWWLDHVGWWGHVGWMRNRSVLQLGGSHCFCYNVADDLSQVGSNGGGGAHLDVVRWLEGMRGV